MIRWVRLPAWLQLGGASLRNQGKEKNRPRHPWRGLFAHNAVSLTG